ncbi:uncharacterized protein LOC125213252 isoform X2 [Salvia hispanica]|uniref:uncharacterized protein LOC125213252 isoform X2 n=1 Tax=Salvia hispanica TaxID=49212 RepID=UPI0020093227|nr:uncharacterized protein LOC125213252 isoform X2 [Salvia hispanica]
MAIGELVHASSQLEVVIAQMKREGSANPSRPAVEAVIAQMRGEGSAYPFRPALEATLAFSLGAFAPILVAAYITEYTVRLAVVIVASTTMALTAIGGLGTVLGRSRVVSSCVRVLVQQLKWLKNLKRIEVDAHEVVNMIDAADLRHVLPEIRNQLRGCTFKISHIPREGNAIVDFLAKQGKRQEGQTSFDQGSAPPFVKASARLDCMGVPNGGRPEEDNDEGN